MVMRSVLDTHVRCLSPQDIGLAYVIFSLWVALWGLDARQVAGTIAGGDRVRVEWPTDTTSGEEWMRRLGKHATDSEITPTEMMHELWTSRSTLVSNLKRCGFC